MKYRPRLNGHTKKSEFIIVKFSDSLRCHSNHIAGIDSPGTYQKAFATQHTSGDLITQEVYLAPADQCVHPPQIERYMLTGNAGGSASSAGETEPEARFHESDILPHLTIRGVIIDQPALVDSETKPVCLLHAHLPFRYLTVSATAARACEIVSVIFIGAVQVPA